MCLYVLYMRYKKHRSNILDSEAPIRLIRGSNLNLQKNVGIFSCFRFLVVLTLNFLKSQN